jgi:hypothetical protein
MDRLLALSKSNDYRYAIATATTPQWLPFIPLPPPNHYHPNIFFFFFVFITIILMPMIPLRRPATAYRLHKLL